MALKGGPRRINHESRQTEERKQRLNPPGIAPGGLAEPAICFSQGPRGLSHQNLSRLRTPAPSESLSPIMAGGRAGLQDQLPASGFQLPASRLWVPPLKPISPRSAYISVYCAGSRKRGAG